MTPTGPDASAGAGPGPPRRTRRRRGGAAGQAGTRPATVFCQWAHGRIHDLANATMTGMGPGAAAAAAAAAARSLQPQRMSGMRSISGGVMLEGAAPRPGFDRSHEMRRIRSA